MTKQEKLKHYNYALTETLKGRRGTLGICEMLATSQGEPLRYYDFGSGDLKKDFPEFAEHEPEIHNNFWWDYLDDNIRIEVLRDCIAQVKRGSSWWKRFISLLRGGN